MANQKQKTIDVVYVLGTGSTWRNNEIRFSLRALEKNLQGYRRIYIVGEDPGFLKNVIHIPYPDDFMRNNPDGNIIRKVLRVCQEEGLSERFLFINDDHLIMKKMTAAEIPPYYKLDLTKCKDEYFQDNAWRGFLFRTKNILLKMGFKALHFDCHVPIVFNKKLFPEVMSRFDYAKEGYTMKSLYGNVVHPDAPLLNDKKVVLFKPYILKDIKERVHGRSFVAYNDDGLRPALKTWLYLNFPKPSKFEVKEKGDPFFDIMGWLHGEREFNAGCRLYDGLGKSRKTKKFLSKGETKLRYAKLEHKIAELINFY